MTMSPVITAQQLNHHFGAGHLKKQVLFDIDLTIRASEMGMTSIRCLLKSQKS
ncbi:hypothetical protein Lepto7375DRAFT_8061 [Leptolyngbya sp. PCC 7375]|nr:hypothetical protein Lepto7375DRAFT_8061 [Leptolyngbya sp. PCC 7375]